jgi:hypothetical protein
MASQHTARRSRREPKSQFYPQCGVVRVPIPVQGQSDALEGLGPTDDDRYH